MARAGAGTGGRVRATPVICSLALLGVPACVKRVETSTATVHVEELRREDTLRTAVNLPESFAVVTPAATPRDCPQTLRDDRLSTRLTLRRALVIPVQDSAGVAYQPFGDYVVAPAAQYGEQEGEGVRVDCTRLRGVGVVRLIVRIP
jgi:hypothetical protein